MKTLENAIVGVVYWALQAFRLVFLTGRTGVWLHNFVYFWLFRWCSREVEHRKLTMMLRLALSGNRKIVEWQRRAYSANPASVRHSLKNIFARRFVIGGWKRRMLIRQGHTIPSIVMMSLNTPEAGCNLACLHCYAVGHDNAILPIDLAKKVIAEQEKFGIYNVRFLGGEPFLYKGIWELFDSFPRTSFYVATNATQLDSAAVARLCALGNVIPMISLEGFEATCDAIRGPGVFRQVEAAMINCRDQKLPYSVTVTVTRQNREEVTSREFLQMIESLGAVAIGYSCYVPMGRSPRPEWQLTPAESEELDLAMDLIFREFAMYPAVGRNGIERVSDCAAAREFVHILPDGQVETCPFAQWADTRLNARNHSLLEIMASPLFAGIRELNSFGLAHLTPCQAPHSPLLQDMFTQLGAQSTVKPQEIIQIERTTA